MENHEELIQRVKELVQANKTAKALELLSEVPALKNEATLLTSRFKRVKDDLLLDVIARADANREINVIHQSIIHLSEKIGQAPEKMPTGPESEPDNSKRKKVVFYLGAAALVLLLGLLSFFWLKKEEPKPQPVLIDLYLKKEMDNNLTLLSFPETWTLANLKDTLLSNYFVSFSGPVDQRQLTVNSNKVDPAALGKTLQEYRIKQYDTISMVVKEIPTPAVSKKYTILGTLRDVFGNPLKDSIVNLTYDSEKERMSTDANGFFLFTDLSKSKSYTLQYNSDPPKIESVKEKDTITTKLITNPLDKVVVTLHDKINEDLSTNTTFVDTKDKPILVPLSSLERDSLNQGTLYYVIRLFGDKEYSDITTNAVNLNWTYVNEAASEPYTKKIKKGNIQFCEWGWRNWGLKRGLFPGEWTLTITTTADPPQVIDKLTFRVVK